jgi:hypothetical protein
MSISQILAIATSLFLAAQPILVALSAIFAILAPVPYVGGPWATSASKLCAILVGDLGGAIRWLQRLLAAAGKPLPSAEVQYVDPTTGTLTLVNPSDVTNFRKGTRVTLASLFVGFVLLGCAGLVPTPTSPCLGLYCLEWSANEVGIPAKVLICAKTEAELISASNKLAEKHRGSTFRTVDQLK